MDHETEQAQKNGVGEAAVAEDAARDSRWVGAGLLRENGTWIFCAAYGIGTLGAILIGLTFTRYPIELAACVAPAFVLGLLIPPVRRRMHLLVLVSVCLVVVLGVAEAMLRLKYFGIDAVTHPLAYSPASTTSVKGLIHVSDDPVRGYELSPGYDGIWNGHRYSINSWGYRDRAFTEPRTPGVLRIVVLGDSFAMATGVEAEEGVSRVLQDRLNEAGVRAEVYNLAVSGYLLPQIDRVLKTDVLSLKPDMVILTTWTWVANGRWSDEKIDWEQVVSTAQHERYRQHIVKYFSFIRGTQPTLDRVARKAESLMKRFGLLHPSKGEKQPMAMPIFLDHMATLGREHGFRPAVLMLRPLDFRASIKPMLESDRDKVKGWCDDRGVLFLDTFDAFPPGAYPNEYIIYPGNSHPNARSHALYAEAAAEQLVASGALTQGVE